MLVHRDAMSIGSASSGKSRNMVDRNSWSPSQTGYSRSTDVIAAVSIMRRYLSCELTTISREGAPQTWPVSAVLLDDGRLAFCTSIGFPQKAINVRRNPKVSLHFSEPTGSGLASAGAVLVRGDAVADDTVIGDMTARPELTTLVRTVCERQPASSVMRSLIGRNLFASYYLRLLITVAPAGVFYWPTRDFTTNPRSLAVEEVRHVASGR